MVYMKTGKSMNFGVKGTGWLKCKGFFLIFYKKLHEFLALKNLNFFDFFQLTVSSESS